MKTAQEVNHDKQVAAIKPRVWAALQEAQWAGSDPKSKELQLASLLVFAKLSNPALFALVEEILRDAA
jgi:hypothetical protein